MKKSTYISFAIVFITLGVMLAIQLNHMYNKDNANQLAIKLTEQLNQIKTQKDKLTSQLNNLNGELNFDGEQLSKSLNDDKEKYIELAGLSDVKGPGVNVVIDDREAQLQQETNPNQVKIYSKEFIVNDLLNVLNELKAAGAEAISLNDERIISTSEITCISDIIRINSFKVNAPYIIKAIGDSKTLESSLKLKGGVVDSLVNKGIKVNINDSNNILIKKYKGNISYKYAKPINK